MEIKLSEKSLRQTRIGMTLANSLQPTPVPSDSQECLLRLFADLFRPSLSSFSISDDGICVWTFKEKGLEEQNYLYVADGDIYVRIRHRGRKKLAYVISLKNY